MLLKLLMVMGINLEILFRRPDNSYVLTADNTKKILAILMRFRYVLKCPQYINEYVCNLGVTFQLC